MHVIHPDRRAVMAAVLALALAFLLALVAASSLSDLDVGGGRAAPVTVETRSTPAVSDPVWMSDPLAPPALLREAR